MRRLFVIIPAILLLTFGLIGWNYLKHQPPSVDVYISDLQSQIDVLQTRIVILERHLDANGR
jgi:hypothetical protein